LKFHDQLNNFNFSVSCFSHFHAKPPAAASASSIRNSSDKNDFQAEIYSSLNLYKKVYILNLEN